MVQEQVQVHRNCSWAEQTTGILEQASGGDANTANTVERALQAGALVAHAAERPHVGLLVVRLALAHLRRDVVRRAEHRDRRAARRRQLLRDAEVAHLHQTCQCHTQVGGALALTYRHSCVTYTLLTK